MVVNETQKAHVKTTRSAVFAAAAAAVLLLPGAASAAYTEPGQVASSAQAVSEAVASWETDEYKKDWGLAAMHASKAYALGFHGQGTAVGIMDSGALIQIHPQLTGDRFHASTADAEYGSSGERYPQHSEEKGRGEYTPGLGAGTTISGSWIKGVNDSHGTHVTGTVGANRDGEEFHGVAWGADLWIGNTGGTDDTNYEPFQDYKFFKSDWSALADNVEKANGQERGGFINNSFGTNTRRVETDPSAKGPDGGKIAAHNPTNTVSETEYEYFLFNNRYVGRGGTVSWNQSFVDAAYEAVKDKNVVQVITTGNRDFDNPFYRPLYPYFNPDAESRWVAADGTSYELVGRYNEAGNAKWWTVAAPGSKIYGSTVSGEGEADYGYKSGTSMAAPHVTGALTVLMSRYQDMNALQVRDVMFTTANHKNPDGSNMKGWDNHDGSTPADGQVSDRMGWGVPDLDKGMYGPGQFLGHFDYNMARTPLDVWTNDISQVALDQRKAEDAAWKAAAEKWMANPTLTLGEEYTDTERRLLGDILLDTADDIVGITEENEKIDQSDAVAWRKAYYSKRLEAIKAKIEQGLYNGSLTKRGEGTLVMTGNNTYRGGTVVEAGTLLGFNDSFGVSEPESDAAAGSPAVPAAAAPVYGNGKVTVNGGTFGLLSSYDDGFTKTGVNTDTNSGHSVDVTVNNGGTLGVAAGQSVEAGSLTFNEGAKVSVISTDRDTAAEALRGQAQSGTISADSITGAANLSAATDYALLKTDVNVEGSTLTATLSRDETKTLDSYASTGIGRSIAKQIESAPDSVAFNALGVSTKKEVSSVLDALDSDFYLSARNATVTNALTLARTVKDQANGAGDARVVEMKDGTARIWATGMGAWADLDYNADFDSDYYVGLVGGEVDVGSTTKLGAFFGYGQSKYDSSEGKIDSDDLHLGLYGVTNLEPVKLTYGASYTWQDRDNTRKFRLGDLREDSKHSTDAHVFQVFGEAAWTGLNTAGYAFEPYFGLSYMRVDSDRVKDEAAGLPLATAVDDSNIGITTLGLRAAANFKAGSVDLQLKGDVAWNHFFGDNRPEAQFQVLDAGWTKIKGEKLSDMATVGVGLEAKFTKNATLGIFYTGAFDGDVTSHGAGAHLRINF